MKSQPVTNGARFVRLETACRNDGLPVTVQRRAILDVLLSLDGHPTAEQTFDAVRHRIPGVARATVYRTLDTFVRLGVIARLAHAGGVTRFDARPERHDHLVCIRCGHIADVPSSQASNRRIPEPRATEFEILDYSIQFRGICRRCRDAKGIARRKKNGNER